MRKSCITLLFVAACGTNANSVELITGFSPTSPDASGLQFVIPPIRNIPSGADQTYCTYLDYRSDKDLDVYNYAGFQSKLGAHHALLYAVDNNAPANTHICNEDDMINARYIAGGGADAPPQYLPTGIVIRLPAKTQVMIQTHWINSTDKAIDGQAAFNIEVEDPDPSHVNAQLFTAPSTMLSLPPGDSAVHTECTVKQDMNFFLLGGHEHEWGTHVKLTINSVNATSNVIYDTPWSKEFQFNPPRNYYTRDVPFTIHTGDTMAVDCNYHNDTGTPILFPKEMCVGWGYFFPAVGEIDCVDGEWPSGV